MVSLKVVNSQGIDQDPVDTKAEIFDVPANAALVHEVAVALRNAQRQGTHKTKTRKEVSGGGTKPFRQKGTGRARRGSIREPHLRGGGTVFGPQPRSYRQKVTVRAKRRALCCVLSDRVRGERLQVLTGLDLAAPKTKAFAEVLDKVVEDHRRTLLVMSDVDKNVLLSARNIPGVSVVTAADVNVLDVLAATQVLVQRDALTKLEERLS